MATKRSGIQQQRLMPSSLASMQCATTGRSDGLNQDYSRGFHLWLASRLDARHTVRRWFGEQRVNMKTPTTPQGLPPHFPHEADRETGEGLEPAYSVSKLHEYAEHYAHKALRAQAARQPQAQQGGGCVGLDLEDHPE